ncbi:MAG: hypothetical protein QOG84_2633, partial [Sphingomonadales bacterium]|nr:hypothetical protein [Sphingomonadales bacterium]
MLMRRLLRILAALTLVTSASAALAQLKDEGAPLPKVNLVDGAGVDLRSGRRTDTDGAISIGAADAPVFTYSLGAEGPGGIPLWGYVYSQCIPSGGNACGGGSFPEVVLGNKREWTRASGYNFLTDGSQIASSGGNTVVYDKEGTAWTFSPLAGSTGPGQRTAYLTSARYANGETLTYHYATLPGNARPVDPETPAISAITSSAGFMLKMETGPNGAKRVRLINRALIYCDPLAASCPAGPAALPTVDQTGTQQYGGTVTFSGTRTVTYGSPANGAVAMYDSQGNPVYETVQSVTSGGGVTKTYTTSPLSLMGNCGQSKVVRQVATPAGTWHYAYSFGWIMYSTEYGSNHGDCIVTEVTSTAPDNSQVKKSEWSPGSGAGEQITDQLGRVTQYAFLTVNWPVQPTAASRREVSGITYPEGNKASFVYDTDAVGARRNLQSTTLTPKPGTAEPTLTWSWGYPTSCTTANYVSCNKPDYALDPKQNRTDYTYDPVHGGVLTKTLPADANGVRPQIRYTYQQLSAKVLDASGQLVNETPIWKLVSTSTCRTLASCAGTADEVVTSYTYSDNLLVATETTRAGDNSASLTVTKSYDAVGNLVAVDGPASGNADTTRYTFDALRRPVATLSPDPDGAGPLPVLATRVTYNGDDQPTQVDKGSAVDQSDAALAAMTVNQSLVTGYDGAGRKNRESLLAGGATQTVTQYGYDLAGRLECTAIRMNPAAFASTPASACALGATGSNGPDRITRNVYDAAGQLLQVQKAYGITTANFFPQTLQQNYATYEYTPNGKQKAVIDANGNRAELRYDGLDRQSCWIFPSKTNVGTVGGDCSTGDFEAYGYDNEGNRTFLRKRDGTTITYSFDGLDRSILKNVPASSGGAAAYSVFYKYDLRGLQTEARFGSLSGPGISNAYDTFGRQTSTTTNMDGTARTISYQYDAASNRSRVSA